MKISTESPIFGIEERVLTWSISERKALLRAADLLAQAREIVGPDTDLGIDLGKGEVVIRDWIDGAVVETRRAPLDTLTVGKILKRP